LAGIGLTLKQGYATLGMGSLVGEAVALSQGFVLTEGFILTAGFILTESTPGGAASTADLLGH
jgi:hypothetical protein